MDKQRILADPTQAGQAAEVALEEGGRVDHAADPRPRPEPPMKVGQPVESPTEHFVIVGAPGIARDSRLAGAGRGRLDRAVVRPQHEKAPGPLEDSVRMAVGVKSVGQVVHLARTTIGQPLLEMVEAGRGDGRRGPGQVESEAERFFFQCGRQRGCVHSRDFRVGSSPRTIIR